MQQPQNHWTDFTQQEDCVHVHMSSQSLACKIIEIIEDNQFGYQKGIGIRNATGLMRIIST